MRRGCRPCLPRFVTRSLRCPPLGLDHRRNVLAYAMRRLARVSRTALPAALPSDRLERTGSAPSRSRTTPPGVYEHSSRLWRYLWLPWELISHPSSFTAYGVDGCRAGWFFVALEPCGGIRWGVVPILADLVRTVGDSDRIFVDIPIGLPEGAESRTCDRDARRRLGRRGSSVFPAPARQVVGIDSFEDANRTSRAVAGKGISRQTFAIVQKVREIDSALRRCSKARRLVREVHPEVCFWALARETPMSVRKKAKEGFRERVSVLTNLRPSAGDEVSQIARPFRRKQVSWDDIADAFVAALTASQPLERLRTLPAVPEYDRYGLPMEMVYADVLSSHVAENLPASR